MKTMCPPGCHHNISFVIGNLCCAWAHEPYIMYPWVAKIFVMITRVLCFHDYIYIHMPIFLAYERFEHSDMCVVDHLWSQKIKSEEVHQGARVYIVPTHQVKYSMWLEGRVQLNELFKIYSLLFFLWKSNYPNQIWF